MLNGGIDQVGAHRVANIAVQMQYEHVANGRMAQGTQLQVTRATTACDKAAGAFICARENIRFARQYPFDCGLHIGQVQQLNLADHDRFVSAGGESPALPK